MDQRRSLVAHKISDILLDDLRRRIVGGEFDDAALLPRAISLVEAYGVSRPTLREAYRVLEAERLISRDPQNHWNFHVHPPSIEVGARMVAFLLSYHDVPTEQVDQTIALLEDNVADDNLARQVVVELLRSATTVDRAAHPDAGDSSPTAIAARIRHRIGRRTLAPGDRLPTESDLREQQGASRVQVREALKILETEGLVRVQRGAKGGALVIPPGSGPAARYAGYLLQRQGATWKHFFALRSVVEVELAGAAAELRAAEPLLRAVERERSDTDAAESHAAIAFHEAVAEAAGRPALAITFSLLESVLQLAALSRLGGPHTETATRRLERSRADHLRLIELVNGGDATGARDHWKAHCRTHDHAGDEAVIDVFALVTRLVAASAPAH